VKVLNITRQTILAEDLKEAKNWQDRWFGLLKKSNPRVLLFQTRFGIHTLGLKTPIDVLVLDDNLKVVKLARVKPGKLFLWNPRFGVVIELPAETIKNSKTKIGDQLVLTK